MTKISPESKLRVTVGKAIKTNDLLLLVKLLDGPDKHTNKITRYYYEHCGRSAVLCTIAEQLVAHDAAAVFKFLSLECKDEIDVANLRVSDGDLIFDHAIKMGRLDFAEIIGQAGGESLPIPLYTEETQRYYSTWKEKLKQPTTIGNTPACVEYMVSLRECALTAITYPEYYGNVMTAALAYCLASDNQEIFNHLLEQLRADSGHFYQLIPNIHDLHVLLDLAIEKEWFFPEASKIRDLIKGYQSPAALVRFPDKNCVGYHSDMGFYMP